MGQGEFEFIGRTYTPEYKGVKSVDFSLDGKYMGINHGVAVSIWDFATGKSVRAFTEHTDTIEGFGFFPDGQRVVSGDVYMGVMIWDIARGDVQKRLEAPDKFTKYVLVDYERIYVGTVNNRVRMWDLEGNFLRDTGFGMEPVLTGCSGYQSGSVYLATSSKMVIMMDAWGGYLLKTLETTANIVKCVAMSKDGAFLAAGSDNHVDLWQPVYNYQKRTYSGHKEDVDCLAFSKDSQYLLSGSGDKTVRVNDRLGSTQALQEFPQGIKSLCVSPNDWYVAVGLSDGTVEIWTTPWTVSGEAERQAHAQELKNAWESARQKDKEEERLAEERKVAAEKRQEELRKREQADAEAKEQAIIERFAKMVRVSDSLTVKQIATALNVSEEKLYDKLFDWAIEFNFRINADEVIFTGGDLGGFIDQLKQLTKEWHEGG